MPRRWRPRPARRFCWRCPAGVAFAALVAAGFGWLCVRLSGVSLAMLTLAFAQIAWAVAFQWDGVTGGRNGLVGVWPPSWLATEAAYYVFATVVAGLAIVAVWSLAHSPFGYALRATRDRACAPRRSASTSAASSGGVHARRRFRRPRRRAVRVLEGLAVARQLSIPRSMDGLVMVLLGGVQTLIGPVVGAAVFIGLQDWIVRTTAYWQAVLGLIVIAITMIFPLGIVGTVREAIERWRARPEGGAA